MPKLSDYISLHYKDPGGGVVGANGVWLKLEKQIPEWARPIKNAYGRFANFVFNRPPRRRNSDCHKENIVMCSSVNNCSIKKLPGDVVSCRHFSYGICALATSIENGGKILSFDMIGAIHGLTKQRTEQLAKKAQERLLAAIQKDPELVEFLNNYNFSNQNKKTKQ